ncbi:MAG: LacI family DNA-binding transcriptional regulator [Luteibaculaceae bacterium]
MKRATIKDISRLAGVNPSTVSRALHDSPDISSTLKNTIRQIAKELKYVPNKMAADFRASSNKTLALIIPEINMFFFPSVIRGIAKVAKENDYQLIVLQSDENELTEAENINTCINNRVSGIMISLSRNTTNMSAVNKAVEWGIPVVFFDKAPLVGLYDTIKIDDQRVGMMAAKFLHEQGAKSVLGFFGHENMSITRDRLEGFRKGIALHKLNLIGIEYTLTREQAHDTLLKYKAVMPEGIFAMSDEIISGLAPAVLKIKAETKKECKIIGVSDGHLPYFFNQEIYFLHHDGELVGTRAAEKVIEKIQLSENDQLKIFTHIIDTPIKLNS